MTKSSCASPVTSTVVQLSVWMDLKVQWSDCVCLHCSHAFIHLSAAFTLCTFPLLSGSLSICVETLSQVTLKCQIWHIVSTKSCLCVSMALFNISPSFYSELRQMEMKHCLVIDFLSFIHFLLEFENASEFSTWVMKLTEAGTHKWLSFLLSELPKKINKYFTDWLLNLVTGLNGNFTW